MIGANFKGSDDELKKYILDLLVQERTFLTLDLKKKELVNSSWWLSSYKKISESR